METLIIYKSIHHGNTLEVIEEMADVLRADLAQIDLMEADMLENYDLVGFGSGIYYGQHYKGIIQFVRKLSAGQLKNKKTFLISTSGIPRIPLFHNFERPLREALKQKEASILDSFNCRGYDDYGFLETIGGINKNRPNSKDLKQARDFAAELYRQHFAGDGEKLRSSQKRKRYSIF